MSSVTDKSARPSVVCEAINIRRKVRCTKTARFRVWQTTFPHRSTPVEESRTVRLCCGTHANSYILVSGWQYDEVLEHPAGKGS